MQDPKNIGSLLSRYESELKSAGVPSARLDTLVLIADLVHKDKSWVLAHSQDRLTAYQNNKLHKQVELRKKHLPLAYIRGFSEFYGRRFRVNRHVLEPRPESETMIDMLKNLKLRSAKLADIGTGSGCLGITAALETGAAVHLYDIDSGAIAVARHNAHIYEVNTRIFKRDLLRRPQSIYEVILANLPYVPDGWQINTAAMHEPRIAIYGGEDGLRLYKRMFEQLNSFTWKPKYIFTECLPPQHDSLKQIAAGSGYKRVDVQDFIQLFCPA